MISSMICPAGEKCEVKFCPHRMPHMKQDKCENKFCSASSATGKTIENCACVETGKSAAIHVLYHFYKAQAEIETGLKILETIAEAEENGI